MKYRLSLMLAVMVLLAAPLFAAAGERANFAAFLDAGAPIKVEEGEYADFGRFFAGLALQARLGGNFYAEFSFAFYPAARPVNEFTNHDHGLEVALGGLWKIAPRKKLTPFATLGLSYAEINPRFYGPDRFWGLNTGGGIECQLDRELLFRLGGAFTLAPIFFESVRAWGKIFAGLGLRF